MPKVLFYQSPKEEVETILWTMKNQKFIEKFCNNILFPKLPKKFWKIVHEDNEDFSKSRKIIKEYLLKTRQLNKKREVSTMFIPLWRKIEKDFFSRLQRILNMDPQKTYVCYITQYGGGGSFNTPNKIWVRANVKNKNDRKYFNYAVAHEIIHLLLHHTHQSKTQEKIEKKVDDVLIATNLFH